MTNAMLRVRDASLENAPQILDIYAYYVKNTAITFEYDVPSLPAFRERMRHIMQRYPYLVAQRDGALLGYAYAAPFNGRPACDWCCELTIYVAHGSHRCGIGRLLYTALEQALREMGICNLYACIACPEQEDAYLSRNSADFHEHLGFREIGMFRSCGYKFGRWYHMIWMEKIIARHDPAQPPVQRYSGALPAAPRLAHTALYVRDLEAARIFFCRYLGGLAGELYRNRKTGFSSYFLCFSDGTQLELMNLPGLASGSGMPQVGYAHTAFALGSRAAVDDLTARLVSAGYELLSGPRVTGDGFYESCIAGPEGILLELTV